MRAGELPERYRGCTDLALHWHGNAVLSIGLDRPAKRNAIGVEMTLSLERTLAAAQDDPALRAIVFHGRGGHFCAGMDMRDFFDHSERDAALIRRARSATDHWRARLLRRLPQPVVCAVEGFCLGGAIPILECADIVLASPTAIFGLPEINFGFVPGGPIAKSIGEMATARGASYAALTGRPFDAQQACRWGLVSQILASEDLLDEALDLASSLAAQECRTLTGTAR